MFINFSGNPKLISVITLAAEIIYNTQQYFLYSVKRDGGVIRVMFYYKTRPFTAGL